MSTNYVRPWYFDHPGFRQAFGLDPRPVDLKAENESLRADKEKLQREIADARQHVASLRRRLYPMTQEERERRRAEEIQADRAAGARPVSRRWFGHVVAPTTVEACALCGGLGSVPCEDIECGRCAHDLACPDGPACICKTTEKQ